MPDKLSPIVLFVYKRPAHTIQVLEKLAGNILADQSDLIIYSDASRDNEDKKNVEEVRKIVKSAKGFKSVEIIERSRNMGLADSIIDGVGNILSIHNKIIVLEDDLLTSPFFLQYMNAGLELYEEETDVISIHAYLYPLTVTVPDTFFMKGADCWGWGTWQRGWNLFEKDSKKLLDEINKRNLQHDFDLNGSINHMRMLKKQIKGKISSWAIRWYASAYLQNKLTLYPGKSLIKNIGFDPSATHTNDNNYFDVNLTNEPINLRKIPALENLEMRQAFIEFNKLNKSNFLKKSRQTIKKNLNFCTLFDSNYFTRGLALYYSLEKNCPDFHLYIFAFDKRVHDLLKELTLNNATVISLKEFEDEKLLKIKPTRSIAEYCWTCTSSTILYVLENYNVESCTYLDADLFFYSSPNPIFEELGNQSILITEHHYSPQYNKQLKAGKYCVQFVTFRNNEQGLTALRWWRARCIEWCYARYEDGKFGDQLYLEDWTERFAGVHVLQHLGGGLAAWNIQQYVFEKSNDKITGTETSTGKKFEVIFYHFHYLKFYKNDKIELGRRTLTKDVLNFFYKPYVKFLEELKGNIYKSDNSFDPHGASINPTNWKTPILYIYRKIYGIYNIFDKYDFLR